MTIDPFTLLIIIFFIVWPLLNALFRRSEQRRPQRPRPPERQPPVQQRIPQQPEPSSDFERRLEEARRRVQEAMGQESQGQLVRPRETQRSQPPPPERRQAAPPPRERRRPEAPPPATRERTAGSIYGTELGTEGREIGGQEERRPVSAYAARAQRSAQLPIGLDSTALPQAIIWREILDKPPARRRRPL
jgi:hypothetical protein